MNKGYKFTAKEFNEYCGSGEKVLSDMDYGYNKCNGKYNVPAVEWEDWYGKSWEYFHTEEEREEALEKYRKGIETWVINYRAEKQRAYWEKEKEKNRIKKMKTLGGMFPELATLK